MSLDKNTFLQVHKAYRISYRSISPNFPGMSGESWGRDIILSMKITLCKTGFDNWDISSESISLGVTDTQMNTHFAQSGDNFL